VLSLTAVTYGDGRHSVRCDDWCAGRPCVLRTCRSSSMTAS